PRVEAEQHYYNARHQKLLDLGLVPHLLSDVLVDSMLHRVKEHAARIKRDIMLPRVRWSRGGEPGDPTKASQAAPW
ncbi:MAG TPA: NAD-dependent dehydratase, partial [Terriglobia bacterium]|nr:NAD-dependent dehydratase [Terriglobia bacterium]